jgi:ABC-2 type transport system permease protein
VAQVVFNRAHIGALLRVRGKLLVRQFTREKGRYLMALIVLLAFGPLVLGATFGTAVGYRQLPEHWPVSLLGIVFVVLWGIWIAFPVVFSSINESVDVTRLLMYPLSQRDLLVSALAGTLFDYPTYLVLPLFVAMVVGFGLNPFLLLLMIIGYLHMVLIGQLVTTAVGGILGSRRVRDVTLIVMSILGSSCYFLNVWIQRLVENVAGDIGQAELLALRPLTILQWFPTGAAVRAFELSRTGAWGTAVWWLAYSLIWLALITWAWMKLMVRLATGQGFIITIAVKPMKVTETETAGDAGRVWSGLFDLSWLPDDIAELTRKELKSVWRLPQRRIGLVQGVLFPFLMAGAFIFSSDTSVALPQWVGIALLPYALLMFWATTQNMLAWEGFGLATLLLTPIPRARIFLAKGMALMVVAGVPFTVIGLLIIAFSRSWLTVLAVITGLCAGLASMAVTAVGSVLFPIRVNLETKGMRGAIQSGGGCVASLGTTILVPLMIGGVTLPAIAPLLLAWWLAQAWIGVLGLIFSAVYAAIIFWYGTRLAGNLMLEREAELLATLQQPDDNGR